MGKNTNFNSAFRAPKLASKPTAMDQIDKFSTADRLISPSAGVAEVAPAPSEINVGAALAELPPGEFRTWCVHNGYTPGTVIDIPLADLDQSPFNPRHFYMQGSIDELSRDLSQQGQQQPIHVSPDYSRPGKYFIHDGGRRVRGLRENKAKAARSIVLDIPLGKESYKLGRTLNITQERQTVFDDAFAWKNLLRENQYATQGELAEDLKVSAASLSKIIALADLPPELVEKMLERREKFTLDFAYAVSRYQRARGTQAAHRLINRIITEDLPVKTVDKLLKGNEGQAVEKSSDRNKYVHRFEVSLPGGIKAGEIKAYGGDSLTITLKNLPREFRDALSTKMRDFLEQETSQLPAEPAEAA
ncbi:ParB/RepB/Spo0J family partition protein [Burkholderia sp. Ac-20365]|uniref:ParB/RepB/Spo0J family partition protein n=1 Tax=Burkholderia sp. Ac-20365 TaxID=2703897 RepID=UPI00197B6699|nr:ParB/RepB/Spo0J family partition protein [Burkholderia sp. Ac-20365]MBN3761047.1 ParB/RepB/Spo0J family partition protein [Burkholderia sp. Ac-20365]